MAHEESAEGRRLLMSPFSTPTHRREPQRTVSSSHKRERSPAPGPSSTLFPLTKLTLGMWTSRRAKLFLLIQEETLIVLVEQKDDRNGTPLGKRASLWKKAVGTLPSPFHPTPKAHDAQSSVSLEPEPGPSPVRQQQQQQQQNRPSAFFFRAAPAADGVLSFELPVKDIVGLDYRNPLLEDARLAVEMRTVRKREFSSISEALSFYRRFSPSDAPPAAAAAPPASAAKEEAPPPFAGLCARKPSLRASMATRPLERFTHATAAATTTALTVFPSPCLPAPLLPLEADSPVAGLASPPAHPAGSAAPCPDDHFSRRLRFDSHASSSFVPVSQVFCYRTVQIEFADPLLPGALARLVSDCTRLLRLSESGISAWALFLPTYGLFYRPWMRSVAAVLWVIVGIFSVACGFLELYRNIPGAKQAISVLYELSGFPEALTWLESHASVRLSILATYMLSKSQLLEWGLAHFAYASRLARSAAAVAVRPFRLVGGSLRPLLDALSFALSPLSALAAFVGEVLQPVWLAVQALLLAPLRVVGALCAALGPLAGAAWETWQAGAAACSASWRSLSGAFDGVVRPLLSAARATQQASQAPGSGALLLSHAKQLWDDIFSGLWRGTRSILLYSSHLAVSLNKHRLSISIAARQRWDRTAGRWLVPWLRWAAASASGLRGAAAQVSMVPCPLAAADSASADSPHALDSPTTAAGGVVGFGRRSWSWRRVDSGLSAASSSHQGEPPWTDDLGGPATAAARPGTGPPSPATSFTGGGGGGGGSPRARERGASLVRKGSGDRAASLWAALTSHWADAEAEAGGHWAEPPLPLIEGEGRQEEEGSPGADPGGEASASSSSSPAAGSALDDDAPPLRFGEGSAAGTTVSHSPVIGAAVPRRPRTGSAAAVAAASLTQRRRRDAGATTVPASSGADGPGCRAASLFPSSRGAAGGASPPEAAAAPRAAAPAR